MKQFLLSILLLFIFLPGFAQNMQSSPAARLSVDNKEVQSILKIYPNPCKDKKVTIELMDNDLEEIKITNITGKEVLIQKMDIPVSKFQLQLNEIPDGIYLLQVKTTSNKVVVKKLMVSKN